MKRITKSLLLNGTLIVIASILVTGCNTVKISSNQMIGGPIYAATDPAAIQIMRTPPLRPHVRLGEITAEPSGDNVSVQKIDAALQKAAAKMGADAVVIVYDRTEVTGPFLNGGWYGRPSPWAGRTFQPSEGRVITGVAIKYTSGGGN
jgi:hypothetical protein